MKYVKYFSIFLIFCIASMPYSTAWSWQTHSQIADAVYHGLPLDVQQKLDINVMEAASNDPDELFKDFYYHSYPKSYGEAQIWLKKGKEAYNRGDYRNASYCYGVASHYISDSFSAPHTVTKEGSNHSKYEDQAKKLTPVATYSSGDLKNKMEDGYNQGKNSWANWLQTKDNSIIQKDMNMGASVALSAISDSINGTGSAKNQDIFYGFYQYIAALI